MRVGAKSNTKLSNSPTTLGVILGHEFDSYYYRTHRNDQLVARVGTDKPQKHWDRAGYDGKGQQKGQQSSPDRRFSQTPPQGWSNRGGGAWAHPSTSPRTP